MSKYEKDFCSYLNIHTHPLNLYNFYHPYLAYKKKHSVRPNIFFNLFNISFLFSINDSLITKF